MSKSITFNDGKMILDYQWFDALTGVRISHLIDSREIVIEVKKESLSLYAVMDVDRFKEVLGI